MLLTEAGTADVLIANSYEDAMSHVAGGQVDGAIIDVDPGTGCGSEVTQSLVVRYSIYCINRVKQWRTVARPAAPIDPQISLRI